MIRKNLIVIIVFLLEIIFVEIKSINLKIYYKNYK